MSVGAVDFLLGALFWLTIASTVYAGLLLGADAVFTSWHQHQQRHNQLRNELDRIDQDAAASVYRIETAYMLTQQQLRHEATRRGNRR